MRTIIPIIHGWDSCRDRRNQSSAGETREDLGGFQPVSMFLIPLSNEKKGALVGWRLDIPERICACRAIPKFDMSQ